MGCPWRQSPAAGPFLFPGGHDVSSLWHLPITILFCLTMGSESVASRTLDWTLKNQEFKWIFSCLKLLLVAPYPISESSSTRTPYETIFKHHLPNRLDIAFSSSGSKLIYDHRTTPIKHQECVKGLTLWTIANQAQHIPEKARPVPKETSPLVNSQETFSEPVGYPACWVLLHSWGLGPGCISSTGVPKERVPGLEAWGSGLCCPSLASGDTRTKVRSGLQVLHLCETDLNHKKAAILDTEAWESMPSWLCSSCPIIQCHWANLVCPCDSLGTGLQNHFPVAFVDLIIATSL